MEQEQERKDLHARIMAHGCTNSQIADAIVEAIIPSGDAVNYVYAPELTPRLAKNIVTSWLENEGVSRSDVMYAIFDRHMLQ